MRRRGAAVLFLLVLAGPGVACESDGGAATVVSHDGRLSFTLDDGREVRLAALTPASDADPGAPATNLGAIVGSEAAIRVLGEADRWGRFPVDLVMEGTKARLSHRLAAEGLALVDPAVMPSRCLDALFAAEAQGEARRAGIWGREFVRDAKDPTLAEAAGRFALVEGVVDSVGETRSTVYLNFGKAYRTDFTALIRKSGGKRLIASLGNLEGRRVRIRGVLGSWQGGVIRLTHERQVEARSAD